MALEDRISKGFPLINWYVVTRSLWEDGGPANRDAFEPILDAAIADVVEQTGATEVATSAKRYWQCPDCGAIHFKNVDTLELVAALDTIPAGGSSCSDCGRRSDASEIYSGELDLDAPDELIDRMLGDTDNVTNDPDTKTWFYEGHTIRGPASRT